MKAKLKATGEVIILNEKVSLIDYARGIYRDTSGNKYHNEELDFMEEENKDQIDWEQRRYEIAKECFAVLMNDEMALKDAAKLSVEQADALIAELKKLPAITEAKLQVVDKVYPMSFEQNRLELHNLEVRIKVSQ